MSQMFDTRKTRSSDEAFILSSWLNSYRVKEPSVRTSIYFPAQTELIFRLLKRSVCYVAVDPSDDDMIFAYAVGEPAINTLHYVYAKHAFRRHGLAKHLCMLLVDVSKPVVATHKYDGLEDVCARYNMLFNPFLKD